MTRGRMLAVAVTIAIACLSHGAEPPHGSEPHRSHAAMLLVANAPRRPVNEPAESLLENAIRRRIYDYIAAHPDATRYMLQKDVHASASSLEWHLQKLARAGLIRASTSGQRGYRAMRPALPRPTPPAHPTVLSNEKRRRIYDVVVAHPGADRNVVRRFVAVSTSTIDWHLDKLEQADLIVRATNGDRRYFVAPKVPRQPAP